MTTTRALIDAEFHDTPIGRCVVLPSRYSCSGAPPCDPPNPAHHDCCDAVDPSDVLAVVETCPRCLPDARGYEMTGGAEWKLPDGRWVRACYLCGDPEWWASEGTGHVRRGFVRVVEVLPVVDQHTYRPHIGATHFVVYPQAVEVWTYDTPNSLPTRKTVAGLTASPGDVVLVTEPWCETCGGSRGWVMPSPSDPWRDCPDCPPSPVRVIHRDGVLGEVET